MKKSYLLGAVCACLLSLSLSTNAAVVNGSLTGPIDNAGVPAGWTILVGSPDTMDETDNVGANIPFGVAPSGPSPDGGTWVGFAMNDPFITEIFGQTLTGLVANQTYEVSWYAGNFGAIEGTDWVQPNAINVLIDSVSIGSGAELALGQDWFSQSVSFTATATTHDLAFGLVSAGPSYLSIDGIAINAVPIPAAVWLFGSGLLGLVGIARRKKA